MIETIDTYQNTVFRPPEVSSVNPIPGEDASSGNNIRIDTDENRNNPSDRFDNSQKAVVQSYNRQGLITQNKEKSLETEELSKEDQRQVEELKRRDREVRAHEQAHLAAGGGFVHGGARFEYQRGPDGKKYAVGGEVSIAAPSGRTPEETVQNMARVKAAALAPADPSSQDRRVAAQADAKAAEARAEMARQKKAASSEKAYDTAQNQEKTEETAAFSTLFQKEKDSTKASQISLAEQNGNPVTNGRPSHRYSVEAYRQNQQGSGSETGLTVSGRLLSLKA